MTSTEEILDILKVLPTVIKPKKKQERSDWAIFTLEFDCQIADSLNVVNGIFNIRAKVTSEIGDELFRNTRITDNKTVSFFLKHQKSIRYIFNIVVGY